MIVLMFNHASDAAGPRTGGWVANRHAEPMGAIVAPEFWREG